MKILAPIFLCLFTACQMLGNDPQLPLYKNSYGSDRISDLYEDYLLEDENPEPQAFEKLIEFAELLLEGEPTYSSSVDTVQFVLLDYAEYLQADPDLTNLRRRIYLRDVELFWDIYQAVNRDLPEIP